MNSQFNNNLDEYEFNSFNFRDYDIDQYPNHSRYMSDYLKKHIGKMVKLEFYFGDSFEIRVGQLVEVEENYVVLRLFKPSTTTVCNIDNIKFVTIAHSNEIKSLI